MQVQILRANHHLPHPVYTYHTADVHLASPLVSNIRRLRWLVQAPRPQPSPPDFVPCHSTINLPKRVMQNARRREKYHKLTNKRTHCNSMLTGHHSLHKDDEARPVLWRKVGTMNQIMTEKPSAHGGVDLSIHPISIRLRAKLLNCAFVAPGFLFCVRGARLTRDATRDSSQIGHQRPRIVVV